MKKIILFSALVFAFSAARSQTDSLQQYVGTYVFSDGSVIPSVDVKIDNGSLIMASTAGNSSLTQLGVDSFSIVEFSGTAVFKREGDKVTNVHIEAGGYVLDGKRQSNGLWIFREFALPKNEELLSH